MSHPVLFWFIIYVGLGTVINIVTPTCRCGKYRPLLFIWRIHPKVPFFYFDLFLCICTAVVMFSIDGVGSGIAWVGWSIQRALAIWYHEKDKFKKAAKALGRVVVTDAGRLAVVKEN